MCGQRSPLGTGCTLGLFEQKNARWRPARPHENAPCEFSADLVIFQRFFAPKNTPIGARMQRCAGRRPSLLIFQLGFGFWSHFARPGSMQNREGLNAAHAVLSLFVLRLSLSYTHTASTLRRSYFPQRRPRRLASPLWRR